MNLLEVVTKLIEEELGLKLTEVEDTSVRLKTKQAQKNFAARQAAFLPFVIRQINCRNSEISFSFFKVILKVSSSFFHKGRSFPRIRFQGAWHKHWYPSTRLPFIPLLLARIRRGPVGVP
jgi:hypothetical protein